MSSLSGLDSEPGERKRKYLKHESDDEEFDKQRSAKPTGIEESEDDAPSDDRDRASEKLYDINDEPFPIHEAFDPVIKSTIAIASNLIQEAYSELEKHAPRSTILQNMLKNAEEVLIPPKAEPPKVAFLGCTSEGAPHSRSSLELVLTGSRQNRCW